MTREDRCWEDLCKRLQRDPATSEESDTCTLRVAFKHALAFADAEAAAMRERAAGVADKMDTYFDTLGDRSISNDYISGQESGREAMADMIAELIRALPAID